ncbi:MAG: transporter related protein [Gemmatimonadetes bacterium]|nr:transporter related protein [Gemmatimonadota bacterium]
MTQLSISNVAVEFGATTVVKDITITIAAGERWGIIGRNGTGKTSLFRLLTGEMKPSKGIVVIQPGVKVTLLEQHRDFGDAETVWEAAAGELHDLFTLERSLHDQADALAHDHSEEAMARYGHDLERFEREGGYTATARVDAVLHGLGFDPQQSRVDRVEQLSGGERGRLGLARQLVRGGDVLLLDEPTNHLDLETTRWLEDWLKESTQTVLLISHDRAFLAAVADHVLHFEAQTATPYSGGYAAFVQQRAERRLSATRSYDKQSKVVAKEQDYIARNLAGQNTRQAKGRRKKLERLPRLSPPPSEADVMALRFQSGERGGDQVVVAEKVSLGVPGRTLLRGFTGRLMRGEVVGLVGANGSGKSTLLKAITGERPVDAGILRTGDTISLAYYRQDLAQVPLGKTMYDAIADLRPLWERRMVQGHLGRFGFSGDEAMRRTETLSGGERARVALAMMTLGQSNLLILDEPTNHLDVESIEALEDAVGAYGGTVLLVSHDRELLRGLTTSVWELRDEHMHVFSGNFGEWEIVDEERRDDVARSASDDSRQRKAKEKQAALKAEQRGEKKSEGQRRDDRRLKRELEGAEARVAQLEKRVAELSSLLESPALYETAQGIARAEEMSRDLASAKKELEEAMGAWESATEAAESA